MFDVVIVPSVPSVAYTIVPSPSSKRYSVVGVI